MDDHSSGSGKTVTLRALIAEDIYDTVGVPTEGGRFGERLGRHRRRPCHSSAQHKPHSGYASRVGGIRRIGRISRIAWVPIARLRVARIPVNRKSVGWVVEIATRWRWRCTHNSYEMPMM